MRRTLAVVVTLVLASVAASQNLLRWDAWQPTGSPQARFTFTSDRINVYPWASTQSSAGVFQAVNIPVAGTYQFHFRGSTESSTGHFWASWSVGGNKIEMAPRFYNHIHQRAVTVTLPAGPALVQFTTFACDCRGDQYSLPQPVLRPVTPPTVELRGDYDPTFSQWWMKITAEAEVLLVGVRRTAHPIGFPGFTYGLEIDLASPHAVAAIVPRRPVQWLPRNSAWRGGAPHGDFYIQAIRLGSNPGFGSRLFVTGSIR